MCGISGIYHPNGSAEAPRDVDLMLSRLVHRGPDEKGVFCNSSISLGIRRLQVIDLLGGSQPISNERGDIHLVCNGEIYDFGRIRDQLRRRGHRFRTGSDVEVIIHLYEEYGLSLFEHIDGMFAFALWDDRRRRLVLARDHAGIKPLYYTTPCGGRWLAFSSELDPLIRLSGVGRELDPVAIDDFFALSYIPAPKTPFRAVSKLSAGCVLVAQSNEVRVNRYWHPPVGHSEPLPDDLALQRLDGALEGSVRRMMVSDVPIGSFLSGGLDSATITYYMSRESSDPVKTFSARFADQGFDEGSEAMLTAGHLGTSHEELWVEPRHVMQVNNMVRLFGEPFADPAQVPTYWLSAKAATAVKVVLSGEGGDEILAGYNTYVASELSDLLAAIPAAVRHGFARAFTVCSSDGGRRARALQDLARLLDGCHLPPEERQAWWRTIMSTSRRRALYRGGFLQDLDNDTGRHPFSRWRFLFSGSLDDKLLAYQILDYWTFLADSNLVKSDRMTMAHSIEMRVPMLDQEVIRAGWELSRGQRIRLLRKKWALRRLMKGRLPDRVVRMRKKGFAVPLSRWFRAPLRDFVESSLDRDRIGNLGIIDADVVECMINSHMCGKADYGRQIWSLICFVCWWDSCFP